MNKKVLAIAISSALAVPMAAQAVKVSVGGHVMRAIMFADDGVASDVMNVDNGASQSRLTLKGKEKLGVGGIDVGFALETAWASNMNSKVTIKGRNGNTGGADTAFNIRQSYIWFGGKFGKVTMGHTSGSYDGVVNKNYSGVGLTGTANGGTTFGNAIEYRTSAGGFSGITLGQSASSLDGNRHDVLRYDTPKFGPIGVSVSVADNQRWNAAVSANTSFSGAKINAAIGYEENTNDGNNDQWGGSASILFSQGTNLSVSYAEREIQAAGTGTKLRDADNFFVGIGHKWGHNAIGITYRETNDLNAANDEMTTWGIGFLHNIPGPRVELYAGYQNHDLDRPGTSLEDVDVFNMGARVRF